MRQERKVWQLSLWNIVLGLLVFVSLSLILVGYTVILAPLFPIMLGFRGHEHLRSIPPLFSRYLALAASGLPATG